MIETQTRTHRHTHTFISITFRFQNEGFVSTRCPSHNVPNKKQLFQNENKKNVFKTKDSFPTQCQPAIVLQSPCNRIAKGFAIDLWSPCNRLAIFCNRFASALQSRHAIALKSPCYRFAMALQKLCNRFAINHTATQSQNHTITQSHNHTITQSHDHMNTQ